MHSSTVNDGTSDIYRHLNRALWWLGNGMKHTEINADLATTCLDLFPKSNSAGVPIASRRMPYWCLQWWNLEIRVHANTCIIGLVLLGVFRLLFLSWEGVHGLTGMNPSLLTLQLYSHESAMASISNGINRDALPGRPALADCPAFTRPCFYGAGKWNVSEDCLCRKPVHGQSPFWWVIANCPPPHLSPP